jgi:hypothetical protein
MKVVLMLGAAPPSPTWRPGRPRSGLPSISASSRIGCGIVALWTRIKTLPPSATQRLPVLQRDLLAGCSPEQEATLFDLTADEPDTNPFFPGR